MKSQYKGIYINAAAWCNQPNCFKKITFADFSKMRGMKNGRSSSDFERYVSEGGKKGASWLYYEKFANIYPDIAEKYFNFKGGGYNGC